MIMKKTAAMVAGAALLAGGAAAGLAGTASAATGVPASTTKAAAAQSQRPAATVNRRVYEGRVVDVRKGRVLHIRAKANTSSAILGVLHNGARIQIQCKVKGQVIDGNPFWYKLVTPRKSPAKWVTARHVQNIGVAPEYC